MTELLTETAAEIAYDDWLDLAQVEYGRLGDLLTTLAQEDWRRPTDCTEWDVHDVVSHLVGGALSAGSPREAVRQLREGRRLRKHGMVVDKMNAVQVAERVGVPSARLIADLDEAGRTSLAARRKIPRAIRSLRVPFGPPLGVKPIGYLMARIYARDEWMHRVDICRAVGREPLLTADHDRRIVADVVAEWAAAHRAAYVLTLTGPAGGRFASGGADEEITIDAVEFCRTVSGRQAGAGLLGTPVPF